MSTSETTGPTRTPTVRHRLLSPVRVKSVQFLVIALFGLGLAVAYSAAAHMIGLPRHIATIIVFILFGVVLMVTMRRPSPRQETSGDGS